MYLASSTCCCKNKPLVTKLSGTDGSVIWRKGFQADYDSSLTGASGLLACYTSVNTLMFDPSTFQIWAVMSTVGGGVVISNLVTIDPTTGLKKFAISNLTFPQSGIYPTASGTGLQQSRSVASIASGNVISVGGNLPTKTSSTNAGKSPKLVTYNSSGTLLTSASIVLPTGSSDGTRDTSCSLFQTQNGYLVNCTDSSGSALMLGSEYTLTGTIVKSILSHDATVTGSIVSSNQTTAGEALRCNDLRSLNMVTGTCTAFLASPDGTITVSDSNAAYNCSAAHNFATKACIAIKGTLTASPHTPVIVFYDQAAFQHTTVSFTLDLPNAQYLFLYEGGVAYILTWYGATDSRNKVNKYNSSGTLLWSVSIAKSSSFPVMGNMPTSLITDGTDIYFSV